MSRVTAQSGDVAGARPVPWSVAHPGVAALASSCAAIAGLALVVVGLVRTSGAQADLLAVLRDALPIVVGAVLFLVGLPSALGYCGAACVTGRELWSGVTGGFVAVLVVLGLVGVVLPVDGLAL